MRCRGLVVGIGPGQCIESAAPEQKRRLRIDPLPEIDAVGVALGRGQDDRIVGDDPGVEIEDSPAGVGPASSSSFVSRFTPASRSCRTSGANDTRNLTSPVPISAS